MADTETYGGGGEQEYAQFGDGQNGQYDESAAYSQQMEGQETTDTQASGDGAEAADGNEDERKLFVGGLSWETTSKDLKDYFTKFGEVVSCTLKTDLDTKRSRGFGFVVFKDVESIEKALSEKEHKLHGRNIDPKRANPRTGAKKIFVGRLDPAIKEDEIRVYFEQFGKVDKLDLPYDKVKDQRRAFCFVEFETEEAVKKCLEAKHKIGEQEVDIKRATPSAGRGGRGGGRGGYGGGWGQGGWGQGYNQNYNNYYNGNYGSGYGYGGYGGYGGYDYNQGYGGWGGYGGYDQGYGGYGGYGGYDYGGWGYGQDQGQQSSYGKAPKRGGGAYHPYNRS